MVRTRPPATNAAIASQVSARGTPVGPLQQVQVDVVPVQRLEVRRKSFDAISPHFSWPADHAWCVATEVDDDSTFIGGTQLLIDELCASAR
jgi:hypothetical protein